MQHYNCFVVSAGSEIQRECRDYVLKHGHLQPGQIYVSKPGRLPCKKIIHAVGPSWQDGEEEEELLEADKQTSFKNGDVVEAFHKNLIIAVDVQRMENSGSGHSESYRTNLY